MPVQTINNVYSPHLLIEAERPMQTRKIRDVFGRWLPSSLSDYHFSLRRFSSIRPLKYFDGQILHDALKYFQANAIRTLDALSTFELQVSTAFFSLVRQTPSWEIERALSFDSPDDIREFDTIWHPEYQRYSEHIFNHLIQIPLYILGKAKSKNYNAPTLSNRADLLGKNSLGFFSRGFDPVVRNAISHGTVIYELAGIRYVDKKSSQTLSHFEFAELFDKLVSTCHSIVCALLIFLANAEQDVIAFGLHKIPLGIRFLLVDGIVSHGGFWPISMVESTISGKTKQLNAVCHVDSRARYIHLFEGISLCRALASHGGNHYDRYFVSMQCGYPVPSSLIIDGNHLRDAIRNDTSIDDLPPKMFETALMWYDTKSSMRKLYYYKRLFIAHWNDFRHDLTMNWVNAGFDVPSSKYELREVENNSSEKYGRIHAHVILIVKDKITDQELLKIASHSIRKLRRMRVRRLSSTGEIGLPVQPKYIWVRFYSGDNRFRTLRGMSWANEELVAAAEWISSPRVMEYFYTRQYDLQHRRVRLKLNPNLI